MAGSLTTLLHPRGAREERAHWARAPPTTHAGPHSLIPHSFAPTEWRAQPVAKWRGEGTE